MATPARSSLPSWTIAVLGAIRSLLTVLAGLPAPLAPDRRTWARTELEALVAPLRGRAECAGKAAVRSVLGLAQAPLTAAPDAYAAAIIDALAAVDALLAPPESVADDAPIALDVAPPAPPAPALTLVPPAPVQPVTPAAPAPIRGEWRKVRSGAFRGEWAALATEPRAITPGAQLCIVAKSGRVRTVYAVQLAEQTAEGPIFLTSDTTPAATEQPIPVLAEDSAPTVTPSETDVADVLIAADAASTIAAEVAAQEAAADMVEVTAAAAEQVTAAAEHDGASLESALGTIATQGASNAAVTGAGSMAGGQLRIVGFSSADGYVTALRNGVKAATADSYKAMLRSSFGFTDEQIAALTVTIIPESALPAGPGITYTPRGKAYHEMTPAERRALLKVGRETREQIAALLTKEQLIAGAVAAGSMLQVSWVGGGTTTVAKVREAFAARGLPYEAPSGPSAERHAGRAVDSLKTRGMDTTRLPGADLPAGIKARWLVGRKLTGKTITAGEAYGRALLIVSLTDGGDLTFDGDAELSAACRAHFDNATKNEVLRSTDLTDWYGATLRNAHYAVKRGHLWYVPAGEADMARALSETLETLWGDHERIPVTTGDDLHRSLVRGLTDEVRAVVKTYNEACETARERAADKARKETAAECAERNRRSARYGSGPVVTDAQIAAACEDAAARAIERAAPSPVIAAKLLVTLGEIAARVAGYRTVLGEDAVKTVHTEMIALRDALEPLCGSTDQRAAMLELK